MCSKEPQTIGHQQNLLKMASTYFRIIALIVLSINLLSFSHLKSTSIAQSKTHLVILTTLISTPKSGFSSENEFRLQHMTFCQGIFIAMIEPVLHSSFSEKGTFNFI